MIPNAKIIVVEKGKMKPAQLFKALDDGVRRRLPKYTAASYRSLLIQNILTNKYQFNLSEAWIDFKRLRGWDLRPFMAEGTYVNSISIFSSDGHLAVGFRKNAIHPRAKMSIANLARILEYGVLDRNIPSRPLWRFTSKEYFASYKHIIRKFMQETLGK